MIIEWKMLSLPLPPFLSDPNPKINPSPDLLCAFNEPMLTFIALIKKTGTLSGFAIGSLKLVSGIPRRISDHV
jgi:hypothetical protein